MIHQADTSTNQSDMDTQLVHHSGGGISWTSSFTTAEVIMHLRFHTWQAPLLAPAVLQDFLHLCTFAMALNAGAFCLHFGFGVGSSSSLIIWFGKCEKDLGWGGQAEAS